MTRRRHEVSLFEGLLPTSREHPLASIVKHMSSAPVMTVTPVKHMTPVTGTLEEHEEKEIEMAYTTVTVVIKHLKGALVNNDIIDGSFMDDQDWELKSFTIEKTVCPPEEAAKPKADPFAADPTDWLAGS